MDVKERGRATTFLRNNIQPLFCFSPPSPLSQRQNIGTVKRETKFFGREAQCAPQLFVSELVIPRNESSKWHGLTMVWAVLWSSHGICIVQQCWRSPSPSPWSFLFVSNTEWLGATSSPGGCWGGVGMRESHLHPAGYQTLLGPWGVGSIRLLPLCTFPL